MPELPEVETVKRGLEATLTDAVIKKVILRRNGLRSEFPHNFAEKLEKRTIIAIKRRAKYLLFYFDNNYISCHSHESGNLNLTNKKDTCLRRYDKIGVNKNVDDNGLVLIAHLGMTGRFSVLSKAPQEFATHDHVVFILEDGRCIIYNDQRRFGMMDLCGKEDLQNHKSLADLAPEPLEEGFTEEYLKKALAKKTIPIKVAIMDQKTVVGVGNIYASEALFMTGISPLTPANETLEKIPALIKNIQKVLNASIKSGGSTLKDFAHVSGESGYFQHNFLVYGKENQPCPKCTTPIKAIRQAGRSSFYCDKCQK